MFHYAKIGLLLVAMSVSVCVVEGMQSTFNRRLIKDCDTLVQKSNFYDLKIILYQHQQSVDCVQWFAQYADQGHCWALYMLARDSFIRNGQGQLEVAGKPLVFALERVMKFMIRFDQDVACWQLFGQQIPIELRMGLRTKIRDWFLPMIRADRKKEFDAALARVKNWFKQFPEGEHLDPAPVEELSDGQEDEILETFSASSDLSDDQGEKGLLVKKSSEKIVPEKILIMLPSPVCVRSMIWSSPNTLAYIPVHPEWLDACDDEGNKIRFLQRRKEVLDGLLQEFGETAHARGFIESLSNEQSGWMATVSNYASALAGYAGPVVGTVFKVFFGNPTQ
jgi:hypothetical protein